MSNQSERAPAPGPIPRTVAEVVASVEPMNDLDQFRIEDLTPEEEAAFYKVLEEA